VVAWFEVWLHFISIRILGKTTSCVFYSNVFNERVVWCSIGGDFVTLGFFLFIIVVHFKLYKIILTTPP
jgi:hypothetical protein